jgi:WD40 repeat protein
MEINPSNDFFFSISSKKELRLWDLSNQSKGALVKLDLATPDIQCQYLCAAWTPSGDALALGLSRSNQKSTITNCITLYNQKE